jgi:queuine/archaeosine tRNA-ribosyltransferase
MVSVISASRRILAWFVPIVLLALITLTIGFGAGAFFPVAVEAGQQLMDSSSYIEAVLQGAE